MKEKITRLAKGIAESEAPKLVMLPEAYSGSIKADTRDCFTVEFQSLNGCSVKGVCFSDAMRVQPVKAAFAGRKADVTVNVDTTGLSEGDIISGRLIFITNVGEKYFDYSFNVIKNTINEGTESNTDGPKYVVASPIVYSADDTNQEKGEKAKLPELPKKDEELESLAAELIRNKDESGFAFYVYKEAIKRQLAITKLYESYIAAYPADCTEAMPREVLLYFSYERDIPHDIAEKLYADIVMHELSDNGLFDEFAPGMSAFAMNASLSGRMNKRLSVIYDRLIYQGMIDRKAASLLPDIFKCHEIRIDEGNADVLLVEYPELKFRVRADIIGNTAYVPVYFNDASLSFYSSSEYTDEEGNTSERLHKVSEGLHYTDRAVFDKPELIEKCFELYPEHPMLLLAACKKITAEGIKDKKEAGILISALSNLELSKSFRKKLISVLCKAGGSMDWLSRLESDDYDKDSCGSIFSAFVKAGRLEEAFGLIKRYGAESADIAELRKTADGLIKKNSYVISEAEFIKLCHLLFEKKKASDAVIELLCKDYCGSIETMLHVMKAAVKRELPLYELPERILTFELFVGRNDDIDEAFKEYIASGKYDDLVVRAYLCVRSEDYFLYEKEGINEEVFFDALSGYMHSEDAQAVMPVICSIALTAHYAKAESISEEEKELCQKLTDRLIEEGLVFRYTKMLRKKIHIPEEISWKYYIEYRAESEALPKLLVKILPDDEQYHQEDMKRVFKNVFVMSTVLFVGDELHYLIYDNASASEPSEEGVINVTKLHRQGSDRMRYINLMLKALDAEDESALKESMLSYVENSETVKELFKLEN